jgi:hypothetical protein
MNQVEGSSVFDWKELRDWAVQAEGNWMERNMTLIGNVNC